MNEKEFQKMIWDAILSHQYVGAPKTRRKVINDLKKPQHHERTKKEETYFIHKWRASPTGETSFGYPRITHKRCYDACHQICEESCGESDYDCRNKIKSTTCDLHKESPRYFGHMEVVKLWFDPIPHHSGSGNSRDPKRVAVRGSIGASRLVLGMKCLDCGYSDSIKFLLLDTRLYVREGDSKDIKVLQERY